MEKVNHSDLAQAIYVFYKTKKPLYIWGGTGIGKSEVVRDTARKIAKEMNLEFSEKDVQNGKFGFIDIRISQLDPSDLRGLPFGEDGKTKWLIPSFFPTNQDGCGIIFLDEINLAAPSIQAAAYQLILDGRLGDYWLPKGWSIIAAGNRAEDKAFTFELARPLANRFNHIELDEPTPEEWAKWAAEKEIDGRMISFALWKKKVNEHDLKNKDQAFLTPRSLATSGKIIIGIDEDNLLRTLVGSAIGSGLACEFVAYNKLTRKIDVEEVLANPKVLDKIIKDIDQKYVLIGAISEHWRNITKKAKTAQKEDVLQKIFNVSNELEIEFSMVLLRLIIAMDRETFIRLLSKNEVTSKRFTKYVNI
jgi:hypothetical protein